MLSRMEMQAAMSPTSSIKGLGDLFKYVKEPQFDDYMFAYRRIGIAGRIINATVDYTWRTLPEILDNETIEKAVGELEKKHQLFKTLKRADVLSNIGRYSVLVIGAPGKTEAELEKGKSLNDVAMLNVYSEKQAEICEWETSTLSPRYGLPKTYKIEVQGEKNKTVSYRVHHSRVIHIADRLIDSEIYGQSKLENSYNYIQDLMKVVGGSSEMFYLGAWQGLVFNQDTSMRLTDEQEADMKRNVEEYSAGLRRHLAVYGMNVQPLPSHSPNPSHTVDILIQLISAASDTPTRILLGSEQGQLASSVDRDMFLSKIAGRRETFAAGTILIPLIDRLVQYGYIKNDKEYTVEWLPLIEREASEIIQDGMRTISALRQAAGAQGDIHDYITVEEVRERLGLDPEMPETKHQPKGDYDSVLKEVPDYEDEPGSVLNMLKNRRKRLKNQRKRGIIKYNDDFVRDEYGRFAEVGVTAFKPTKANTKEFSEFDWVKAAKEPDTEIFAVLDDDGNPMGLIAERFNAEDKANKALYIAQIERAGAGKHGAGGVGQGVGDNLITHAVHSAHAKGVDAVYLTPNTVRDSSGRSSADYYRKKGFAPMGSFLILEGAAFNRRLR